MSSTEEYICGENSTDCLQEAKLSPSPHDDDVTVTSLEEISSDEPKVKKRRKQSNPVRCHTTPIVSPDKPEEIENMNRNEVKTSDEEKFYEVFKDDENLYRCLQCDIPFKLESELKTHIEKQHMHDILEARAQYYNKAMDEWSDENTGVKDLSLKLNISSPQSPFNDNSNSTTESQHKDRINTQSPQYNLPVKPPLIPFSSFNTVKQENTSSAYSNSLNSFQFHNSSQGQSPSTPSRSFVTSTGVRIFNAEAFCDLCNKEFCNKYFLKTHKANKHGVYTSETSSSYHGTMISNSSRSLPVSFSLSHQTSDASSLKQSFSGVGSYCEICQKEFCNKYFLRKHKQKLHGIYDPEFLGSGTVQVANSGRTNGVENAKDFDLFCGICKSNFTSTYNLQNHKCVTQNILLSNEISRSLTSAHSVSHAKSPESNSSCADDYYFNKDGSVKEEKACPPFDKDGLFGTVSKTCFQSKQPKVDSLNDAVNLEIKEIDSDHPLPKKNNQGLSDTTCINPSTESRPLDLATTPTHQTTAIPKGNNNAERVTSPHMCENEQEETGDSISDVCCGLCSRPFSSLHMLKMHKFYVHNASLTEDSCNSLPCERSSNIDKIIQPEPDNVTPVEQNVLYPHEANVAKQDLNRQEISHNSTNHLEESDKYSLQYSSMNGDNISARKDNMPVFIQASSPQRLANIQLRKSNFTAPVPAVDSGAYCEICQKEFCSKYFLKTHKQKIHGIGLENVISSKKYLGHDLGMRVTTPICNTVFASKIRNSVGHSFCSICNKELCNKYFMKTHMLKMHGINIENNSFEGSFSNASAFTCDICQKELGNEVSLKIHKQNCHSLNEEIGMKDYKSVHLGQSLKQGNIGEEHKASSIHYADGNNIYNCQFNNVESTRISLPSQNKDSLKGNLPNGNSSLTKQKSSDSHSQELSDIEGIETPSGIDDHDVSVTKVNDSSVYSSKEETTKLISSDTSPTYSLPEPSVKMCTEKERQIYKCSFCAYSTQWLSNLYAHEKRHTQQPGEEEKKFICRICHRAFYHSHSLLQHMKSHKLAFGDASQLVMPAWHFPQPSQHSNSSLDGETLPSSPHKEKGIHQPQKLKRYRCSKCNKKFRTRERCLAHISAIHKTRKMDLSKGEKSVRSDLSVICRSGNARSGNIENVPIGKHFDSTMHSSDIIIKERRISGNSITSPDGTESPEVLKGSSLQTGMSFPAHIPMPYVMPETHLSRKPFIMQPFLIAEPQLDGVTKKDTFVPSLVYLPVSQKVSQPLTVSFTLTPA